MTEIKFDNYIAKRCHKNCITSLSIFNDKIASGGKDSTVLIHQKEDPELKCVSKYNLSEVNGNKCNITSVDYLNDLVVASTTLGLVNVIDSSSSTVSKFKAHMDVVSCVKFYTDNTVITSGFDNKVRLWDLRNLKLPTQDLIGHTAGVNCIDNLPMEEKDEYLVSFGEGYEKILSCSSDKTVRLWNVNSGTHLVFKIPVEMSQNVESCCLITKRPNYVFAVGLDDNYLLIYTSKFKNCVYKHSFGPNVSVNCIRHHGGLLLVGTSSGDVCVFRLSDGYYGGISGNLNGNDNTTAIRSVKKRKSTGTTTGDATSTSTNTTGNNSNDNLNGLDDGVITSNFSSGISKSVSTSSSSNMCELLEKISFTGSVNDIVVLDTETNEYVEGNYEVNESTRGVNAVRLTLYVALGTEVRLGRWSTVDSKEAKNQIIIKKIAINI